MKYLSVCSGIEAATVAWHPLGFEPVAFSEIEPFPSKVLAHHYPGVPNLGDMTKFNEWSLKDEPEILVGGTPCQSFSVAGLRKGLADERGNLMLTYLEIANKFRPRWLVWENVPGCLSTDGGRDFGALLGGLAELGYGFAYRVLDAQYFGLAQRRKRVFVVGCLGNWRGAASVLFERGSLSGNPAPSREKRQEAVGNVGGGFATGIDPNLMATLNASDGDKWGCDQWVNEGKAVVTYANQTVGALCARDYKGVGNQYVQEGKLVLTKPIMGLGIGGLSDPCPTLTKEHSHAVAFGVGELPNVAHCLRSGASTADKHESTTYVVQPIAFGSPMQVRRLTLTECERLQGFPDGYTDIRPNGKDTPDGPRYKALGNSMAVPVMRWIGERIKTTNEILKRTQTKVSE